MMPAVEKRVVRRQRVLKGAIITASNHATTITCAVRDVSVTGARVRVDCLSVVPSAFTLVIELDGYEVACEVVWQRGRDLGARFISPRRPVKPARMQVITPMK